MPIHGKIVVINRSGTDGIEFPLTANCLFGRRPDCHIRIQLPHVSKEHCRIDLNENKEVVLTNLSSVNPTRVNGEILQQSERLKHGDVITIIDRSFRFEYPPAPTPKKRSSTGSKTKTLKVFQDSQLVDAVAETGEKRVSEVFTDGTNHDNIQRSLEKTMEFESKEDDSQKTISPFNDLYQMIRKSFDDKTTKRSSTTSLLQTPATKFCTPKTKQKGNPPTSTGSESTPKKDDAKVMVGADENAVNGTPRSLKKQRESSELSTKTPVSAAEEAKDVTKSETASLQKNNNSTPEEFTVQEVIEQTCDQSKSPMRRKSRGVTPTNPVITENQEEPTSTQKARRVSPRNVVTAEKVKQLPKKRKSGELSSQLSLPQGKKKRVSFGGYLSPELFDKRLPPNSPLCKGATPRRSLCLLKSKQSLLRRASVIGLVKEFDTEQQKAESPKKQTPKKSPTNKKASPKAPTPEKKSPKSNTPKVASPGAKMPKSRSSSPRAASPGNKMPSSKASPKTPGGVTKNETPQSNKQPKTPGQATPGKTPVNPDTFTPTVQGRFSVSRISTPSPVSENAAPEEMPAVGVTPRRKSMRSTTKKTPVVSISAVKVMRRSGISRASMKIKTSFADIVKFGQAKTSAVALAKKQVVKKPTRKAATKPQTPARKLQDHVSTGHADSPMTIVVGRAHKRQVVQPTGAAPRMVTNVILGKKIMKMDEDLTGISEMFKTPAHGRKRKSIMDKSLTESPKGLPSTPVVDPSVLNTPEEPGEMMVSPLSVVSTGRGRRFTSEAVQRLLKEEQESSFVNDVLVLETEEESSDPQSGEGPVETPKQKPDQPLFLTPRPRVEPLDDLRGKLLKTPKQKPEQKDCLTGVKRIMKTPRDTIEPVEDIRGRLLVTPKQKPEPRDCLTGVKEIFDIPQWEDKALEDLQGKLETPDASKAEGMSPVASEMMDMLTPNVKATQMECLTGVKRIMKTPKEKGTPVEDMVGVKRILTTPRQKGEPVEDNFGIKRLVKSPKQRGNAPVEDFEGLQQLMEEPLSDRAEAIIVELEDQAVPNCGVDIPQEATVSDQTSEMLPEDACEPSPAQETVLGTTVVDSVPVEEPIEAAEILNVPEERAEEEISVDTVTQMSPVVENAPEKKPVRGQRARAAESNEAEGSIPLGSEVTEAPATVKGRRGKKPEATVTSTVRQTTRSRNAKTETQEIKVAVEQFTPKSLIKSKKGRNAEKALEAEMVQEARNKMEVETEGEQNLPVEDNPPTNDHVVPEEKLDSKPKRGRKIKHPEIHEYVPEQRDLNTGATDLCDDLVEVVPTGNDDNKLSEVMETAAQVPVTETLFSVEADKDASIVQKKSGPGTRAKMPEIKQEGGDMSEDNTITASVRGRRGRKIEAVVLPAARQTTRARKVRLQETNSNDNSEVVPEKSAETQPTAEENKTEENAVVKLRRGRKATQTPSVPPKTEKENMVELKAVGNVSQEENDSVIKEAVVKPTRGRKAKLTSVKPPQPEPEKTEDEVDQIYSHATQEENEFTQMAPVRPVREKRTKQKPASELPQTEPEKTEVDEPVVQEPQHTTVTKKPRKGRKIQCDAVEQNDITDVVKTKQESQPSVRTRGRNAKQEEKVMKNSTDLARSSFADDPIKKLKRTRKTEQDDVEPRKEIQAEVVVPQEAEVKSAVEPQEIIPVSVKPRRGRLAKKCHDDEISESIEVKEVPAVQSRKPRQGRRGVTVEEDVATVEVLEENSENLPEAENAIEPDTPVTKAVRRRGVKTSIKDESSQVNPAKRARRGATAAPAKEASVEPTLKPSSPVSNPVELPKRGRRVAAAVTKLRLDKPLVSNDLPDLPDDSKNAADPQDPKTNKRAVRWKVDMEVFDIPKSTPGKPVRGRRTKLVDQVEQEKKDDTSKSEEKDLSGEVVEVQPMKKARRGAKVNEKPKTHVEPEIQPQTRRGRSARK